MTFKQLFEEVQWRVVRKPLLKFKRLREEIPWGMKKAWLKFAFRFSRHVRWEYGRMNGLGYYPQKFRCYDKDYRNGLQWGREQSHPIERQKRIARGEPEPYRA